MTALSDDFNRADSASLGANWTENTNGLDISSNHLALTGAASHNTHNTSLATISQYVMFSWAGSDDVNTDKFFAVLRFTDTSSPFYTVSFYTDTNAVEWRSHTSLADTTGTLIDSGSLTQGVAETMGVTIDGTGTSTVVRVWQTPTGLPDDATSWNGDATPDLTFTANPGSAVDSGLKVGFGHSTSNPFDATLDDWFGGDNPVAYTLEQEGFRFRDDDGSESAATWLASQDTNITRALATNTRLRILIDSTGDAPSASYSLEYQINGGGFSAVPVGASTKTQPVIEVADVTESGNNTASTTWAINHPNASTGDLLIWCVAWDDSTTTTDLTAPSGPNGETLSVLVGPTASSATSVRGKAFYTVATGSWTAGTRNFTPSASEQWTAAVIRVPAGEFDSSTPIGASNSLASVSTGNPSTPTLTAGASDGSGTLVTFISSDVDDADGTMTGWTSLASTDRGAVGIDVLVRDAAVTNSESISSSSGLTYPAAHDWVSFCFVVRAPTVTNPVYVATSANISASGAATTAQLTAPSGKSTSDFVAGRIQDDENPADAVDITTDDYTELEWCLSTQSPAANTDVVQFRIAGLDTYTVTPQWTIGDSGAISGSTSITFSTTGTLTGTGALTGSSTLTFSPTATIQGLAPITGASTITFTTSGTMIGVGALSGSSTITFSPTATLTGAGALVGSSTLTFSPTATLTGSGALSGLATITFSVSGTLADAGSGVLSGSTTITFTVAGVLTGTGDLAGSTTLTFSPSGVLTDASTPVAETPVTGGGFYNMFEAAQIRRLERERRRKRRKEDEDEIQAALDRQVAQLLYEQEQKDAEKADLERIQALADRLMVEKTELPRPILASVMKANEERTRNSLLQLERMISQMLEEEEAMVAAFLLMDD